MTSSASQTNTGAGIDPRLAELAEDLAIRLRAGEPVDLEGYLAEHPAQAEELRRLLPAIAMMADLGRSAVRELGGVPPGLGDPGAALGTLGDYRIVREVGRGGMGVVYEARQLSLNRRVALKVLPFAATIDPRQLQRFQNEAQAAAGLHHTHIVPVFAVGCERGVHYYAMQFIEGRSLAQVIGQLREPDGRRPAGITTADAATRDPALASDRGIPGPAECQAVEGEPVSSGPDPVTPADEPTSHATAGWSSGTSITSRPFFQVVARLGIQAAEALEYAHSLGVVHRDIKPANLLVDPQGDLWVTDFGLARLHADVGLTMTGDVLGTLRYMSPEQALAKRGAMDHRTDIYSLGVTLYELLTLRPAVEGKDREEILRRIAFDEPRPLRRLNTSVPRELETIVLKAIAKEPGDRYATSQELSEDLRRYLEDKPIRAKRPGLLERSAKWSRRHRPVVAAVVIFLVLAVVGLSIATTLVIAAYRREAGQRRAADALRILAESRETEIRRRVRDARHAHYVAEIHLAAQWIRNGDARSGESVLNGIRPAADEEDVRGFEWFYLKGQVHQERATLRDHEGDVYHVEFAPDGRTLATAGKDRTARIWDATTLRPQAVLRGHTDEVNWVTYAPDGRTLATASDDGTVRLWGVADGRPRATLFRHNTPVVAALFTPDGRGLISACTHGGSLRLWDVDSGRELSSWGPVAGRVEGLALSPTGTLLAMGGSDRNLHLFDLKNARVPREITFAENHAGVVTACVAFAPDGRTLAATCGANVDLYDTATRRVYAILQGDDRGTFSVAFSSDGRMLTSAEDGGTIRFWDLPDGQLRAVLGGHTARIWCVAFAPDGNTLASASKDGSVKLWDYNHFRNPTRLEARAIGPHTVIFSPDGASVSIVGVDGSYHDWDTRTGSLLSTASPTAPAFVEAQTWEILSPDRRTFVAIDNSSVTFRDLRGQVPPIVLTFETGYHHLVFDADGNRFAFAYTDGSLSIRESSTGRELTRVRATPGRVEAPLAFIPGGDVLVALDGLRSLGRLDPVSGRLLKGPELRLSLASVALAPDGRTFATGDGDQTIRLIDTATLQVRSVLRGHTASAFGLAFAPDGKTLASGSRDRSVRLWDVATGQELLKLEGHHGTVGSVRFAPDGMILASLAGTAQMTHELFLWRGANGGASRSGALNKSIAVPRPPAPGALFP